VRVKGPELTPYYGGVGALWATGKAIYFDNGKGGPEPTNMCASNDFGLRCEWKTADYVYSLSDSDQASLKDPKAILQKVEDLLNGFEADASVLSRIERSANP